MQSTDAQGPGATPKSEAASTPDETIPRDRRNVKERFSYAGEKESVPYNIGDIEERSFPTVDGSSAKSGALGGKTSFEESVPQNGRKVKERFSYDGETASETAQEEELKGLSLPTLEPQEDANGYDGKTLTTENGALPFKTGTLKQDNPGGNTPSENSILEKIRCVKNESDLQEKFSLDHEGDGAVEIEAHTDKYAGTKRMDTNLKRITSPMLP